jgi:hypothetical protein
MKKLIPISLILASIFMLQSCASKKDFSSSSVFQKRKHLKGYHLNLKSPMANKSRAKKSEANTKNTTITPPEALLAKTNSDSLHEKVGKVDAWVLRTSQSKLLQKQLESPKLLASRENKMALHVLNTPGKAHFESNQLLQTLNETESTKNYRLGKLSLLLFALSLVFTIAAVVFAIIAINTNGLDVSGEQILAMLGLGFLGGLLSIASLVLAITAVVKHFTGDRSDESKKDVVFAYVRLGFFLLTIIFTLFGPIASSFI